MGVEYVVSLEVFSEWYLERKENLLQEARRWKEKNRSLADDFLKEWPLEKLKDMNLSIKESILPQQSLKRFNVWQEYLHRK